MELVLTTVCFIIIIIIIIINIIIIIIIIGTRTVSLFIYISIRTVDKTRNFPSVIYNAFSVIP